MYPAGVKSLLDAIVLRAGASRVTYLAPRRGSADVDAAAAAAVARTVDVAIVALAEPPSVEQPGNVDELAFPAAQLRLARAIEASGTPVVLTVFHNRPGILRDVVDDARAVVTGYETGPFGGEAMAAVLFGDLNPSGKLPFSWPRHSGSIIPYDHTGPVDGGASAPRVYDPGMALRVRAVVHDLHV
jgi:Glycosyl hydrolase family 3 C terminal domain.